MINAKSVLRIIIMIITMNIIIVIINIIIHTVPKDVADLFEEWKDFISMSPKDEVLTHNDTHTHTSSTNYVTTHTNNTY